MISNIQLLSIPLNDYWILLFEYCFNFSGYLLVCKTTEDKTTSLGGEAYEVPDQNVECVFPFSFEGEVYSKCTNEFACETCFWCGTTYNVTDATGWGLCNEFCPTEDGE